jgi:hypothetical protein
MACLPRSHLRNYALCDISHPSGQENRTVALTQLDLTKILFHTRMVTIQPFPISILAALSSKAAQVDMSAVLLALDFAWQWYKFRSKDSLLENDKAYQSSSITSNHKSPVKNGKSIRSYHDPCTENLLIRK